MNNSLFIDTWGWLTLNDQKETLHQETVNCYRQCLKQKWLFFTSDYVLDETFTLLFKRLNNYQAQKSTQGLLNCFLQDNFNLININQERFYRLFYFEYDKLLVKKGVRCQVAGVRLN